MNRCWIEQYVLGQDIWGKSDWSMLLCNIISPTSINISKFPRHGDKEPSIRQNIDFATAKGSGPFPPKRRTIVSPYLLAMTQICHGMGRYDTLYNSIRQLTKAVKKPKIVILLTSCVHSFNEVLDVLFIEGWTKNMCILWEFHEKELKSGNSPKNAQTSWASLARNSKTRNLLFVIIFLFPFKSGDGGEQRWHI